MGLTADDFIKVVSAELGYKEQKDGTTKYGQWYASRRKDSAFSNAAWCDMFLAWCAHRAAGEEGLDIIGEFAFTPYHATWFARQGRFGNSPKKGAIVFFDWSGSKSISAIDHVGVVKGVDSLGRIVTIEGNTENAVKERYRSPLLIVGYGYPKYSAVSKSTTSSTKPKVTAPKVPEYPLSKGHVLGCPKSQYIHDGTDGAKYEDAVRTAQARFKERGWAIKVDGIFGPKTQKVTKAFQAEKNLEVDGLIGPITWKALWTAPIT